MKVPDEQRRHIVWCEDGDTPTVIHPTWAGAYRAASRLAEQHPGQRFHIMQTRVIRVCTPKPESAS